MVEQARSPETEISQRIFVVGSAQNGCLLSQLDRSRFDPEADLTKLTQVAWPQLLEGGEEALSQVWAGPKHCLALTTKARLVMWGEHDSSQTEAAPKDAPFRHINLLPVPVPDIDSVDADDHVSVSCGFDHTLICTQQAEPSSSPIKLYVWGKNSQGQLGQPKKTCKLAIEPLQVPTRQDESMMIVGASARSSILISQHTGNITVFGFNKDGLLGVVDKSVPAPFTIALEVPIKVTQLSCGFKHAAFLDSQGNRVFASGSNMRGQLGIPQLGDQINQFVPIYEGSAGVVTQVLCSWHNTVVQIQDDSAEVQQQTLIAGDNKYGQLAEQTPATFRGTFAPIDHHFANVGGLKRLHCMAESFLAVTTQRGELYAWGWNEHGNLGLGDKVDRCVPERLDFDQEVRQIVTGGAFFFVLTD